MTMNAAETGFLDRSTTVGGRTYPYVVYVPRHWKRSAHLPVILFLHGSGERGDDGQKQTQIGLAAALRANAAPLEMIVVFPQAPAGERWLGDPARAAMQALDEATTEFGGDRQRTYLTGLSMGGYGTWHLAIEHPDRFAALVVVCGGLLPHASTTAVERSPLLDGITDPYAFVAERLREMPVWIFHGDADTTIPVDESRHMAEALRRVGAPVHYTEYPGVGHASWDPAYREPPLWRWLFEQSRGIAKH